VKERPEKIEAMAESVHTWIEANRKDVIVIFGCEGGARDGLTLAVPWDRKQATLIRDYITRWLEHK
jgi:hypothetical protein